MVVPNVSVAWGAGNGAKRTVRFAIRPSVCTLSDDGRLWTSEGTGSTTLRGAAGTRVSGVGSVGVLEIGSRFGDAGSTMLVKMVESWRNAAT